LKRLLIVRTICSENLIYLGAVSAAVEDLLGVDSFELFVLFGCCISEKIKKAKNDPNRIKVIIIAIARVATSSEERRR